MILVKIDRPRPIDQVIDYFGEWRLGEGHDARPGGVTHPTELREDEADR